MELAEVLIQWRGGGRGSLGSAGAQSRGGPAGGEGATCR